MATILPLTPGADALALPEAARIVRLGGVLAVPTESFYALAAPAMNQEAVGRVWAMKGRPAGKPILVLIGDRVQLSTLVREVPPAALLLMDRFWPGPLTLIFRAADEVPTALTAGTGTVGVRHTAHPPLVSLLRHVGPLTGTSANRSGERPAVTAEAVAAVFGNEVDLILDGGPAAGGPPSTLVDTAGPLRVLREGPLTRGQIAAVLSQAGFVLES